jgi:hypothetical protein
LLLEFKTDSKFLTHAPKRKLLNEYLKEEFRMLKCFIEQTFWRWLEGVRNLYSLLIK